mmetsp:Transcript_13077/g.52374  ORF Transcript_13077/g.52374 Transcript_13077/m.52374 type:complete len:434 (-) Transcript_13077:88-1389(-)
MSSLTIGSTSSHSRRRILRSHFWSRWCQNDSFCARSSHSNGMRTTTVPTSMWSSMSRAHDERSTSSASDGCCTRVTLRFPGSGPLGNGRTTLFIVPRSRASVSAALSASCGDWPSAALGGAASISSASACLRMSSSSLGGLGSGGGVGVFVLCLFDVLEEGRRRRGRPAAASCASSSRRRRSMASAARRCCSACASRRRCRSTVAAKRRSSATVWGLPWMGRPSVMTRARNARQSPVSSAALSSFSIDSAARRALAAASAFASAAAAALRAEAASEAAASGSSSDAAASTAASDSPPAVAFCVSRRFAAPGISIGASAGSVSSVAPSPSSVPSCDGPDDGPRCDASEVDDDVRHKLGGAAGAPPPTWWRAAPSPGARGATWKAAARRGTPKNTRQKNVTWSGGVIVSTRTSRSRRRRARGSGARGRVANERGP